MSKIIVVAKSGDFNHPLVVESTLNKFTSKDDMLVCPESFEQIIEYGKTEDRVVAVYKPKVGIPSDLEVDFAIGFSTTKEESFNSAFVKKCDKMGIVFVLVGTPQ